MAMIKCSECGKDISDKAAVCIGCGAPLISMAAVNISSSPSTHINSEKNESEWVNRLLGICEKFSGSGYYIKNSIPEKKLKNAMKEYPLPKGDIVLALIDTTIFGSAKEGVAIGQYGLSWKNITETARKMSWENFAVTQIEKKNDGIHLDGKNRIESSISANVDDPVELLTEIQNMVIQHVETTHTLQQNQSSENIHDDAGFDYVTKLQTAAGLGFSSGQCKLAAKYESGDGVPQDFEKAIYWYRLAAVQGNEEAQTNIGLMCANGQVVIDGVKVGDVSGDGKIDYEDFELAYAKSKQFVSDNSGQSTKDSAAAALEELANNSGPSIQTESQKKREQFKAALGSTIDVKFADIMRGKSGSEIHLTFVDAKILTASVRNIFKNLLQVTPPQIDGALIMSEVILAPSTKEKFQLIKTAYATAGGVAGIALIMGSVAVSLGWGVSATHALVTFFVGGHVFGPIGSAAVGVAILGLVGYFVASSSKEKDTERFMKVLKNSTEKAIDAIWEEHESALSKILP